VVTKVVVVLCVVCSSYQLDPFAVAIDHKKKLQQSVGITLGSMVALFIAHLIS